MKTTILEDVMKRFMVLLLVLAWISLAKAGVDIHWNHIQWNHYQGGDAKLVMEFNYTPELGPFRSNISQSAFRDHELTTIGSVNNSNTSRLNQWRWANDYWGTTDKLIHALFYGTVYHNILDWTGNRYWALGIALFIAIPVNEGKDALVPWEIHGALGGDGWSWWDIGADIVGVGYAAWFPRSATNRNSPQCSRSIKELLPKVELAFSIGLGWTAGWMICHQLADGEILPTNHGDWRDLSGKDDSFTHVISNFNGEVSFVGPWWMMSHLRPYLNVVWRAALTEATLIGFETYGGYIDDRDVPFFGSRGYKQADIVVGTASLCLALTYELFFFPQPAVCQLAVAPNSHGQLSLKFNW